MENMLLSKPTSSIGIFAFSNRVKEVQFYLTLITGELEQWPWENYSIKSNKLAIANKLHGHHAIISWV